MPVTLIYEGVTPSNKPKKYGLQLTALGYRYNIPTWGIVVVTKPFIDRISLTVPVEKVMKIQSKPNGKSKQAVKREWSMPNFLGQSRIIVGGDWRAAMLLYRIIQVWKGTEGHRLRRGGKQYIAMSRHHWAQSAGLSESEAKNYALPILRANCGHFLTFEQWKLRPHDKAKLLWVHVDVPNVDEPFELLHFYDTSTQQPVSGIGMELGVVEP